MIGFSTGCLYKHIDPVSKEAIEIIASTGCEGIEICAGLSDRIKRLFNLNAEILKQFKFVSFHAPTDIFYGNDEETKKLLKNISNLQEKFQFKYIVMHPDLVKSWEVFEDFNLPFVFENMDKFKDTAKTVEEMKKVFSLKNSPMVLDLTHAYTNDPSMKLAKDLYKKFKSRICHFHLSGSQVHGIDCQQHYPIFITKQKEILNAVPLDKPIIIESVLPKYGGKNKVAWMKNQLAQELNYIKDFLPNEN